MIQVVKKYIADHDLCPENGRIVVGVSGGADSVVLLDMLFHLGYECFVCHCNFRLRGNESDRDESFVQNLSLNYSLPYHKTDFDTIGFAQEKKISIEMAARDLRYEWFEKMRVQLKADAIAVAHHRDDSIETVLLNLTRGTGIRGLTGIRPKNGYIIRPLLCLSKENISDYVNERNLSFVTDSTNEESIYTRNFIRREIIPLFDRLNPGFRENVQRTADHLSETEAFYSESIDRYKQKAIRSFGDRMEISVSVVQTSPAPKTLLFELLSSYGFNSSTISDISDSLEKTSGKEFFAGGYRLIKDRDYLILTKNTLYTKNEGSYLIPENVSKTEDPVSMNISIIENNDAFVLLKDRSIAYFDKDKIKFPLVLRKWKDGDSFVPFGMTGRKKISDYFSDRKFSLIDKENIYLLCSGDNIIWIVGERSDDRFKISDQTKNILIIQVNN